MENPETENMTLERMALGAELSSEGGVRFRVWAPGRNLVEVLIETSPNRPGEDPEVFSLEAEEQGYFSGRVSGVSSGMLYRFRLDREPLLLPDPASRFQPDGPHGPSMIVDPSRFPWKDRGWSGIDPDSPAGHVIYEMHIGTFTREGTWEAAARELSELASLGVTIIELMPVADFPGRFGWGYDCVNLFAPTRLYGRPDAMRQFIDRAHGEGLGVILDVVYNHQGPDGNYLHHFSSDYFSSRHVSEWGASFNFDDVHCEMVREYIISNAVYWITEFHLDGLRIDATQQIFDDSGEHILASLARRARKAARPRSLYIIGENEPQDVRLLRPSKLGGYELDALWNDDFHHSAMVAATGRAEAYYSDYRGKAREFVAAAKYGFLYQGQWYTWQKKRRGTPALDLKPNRFVHFIQNHDQIANSGNGKRIHALTSPGRFRALTAMLLLGPQTPMLFQGQEYGSSSPFFYFADHEDEISRQVAKGRAEFLAQFRPLATPEMQARLPDPGDPMTFVNSKLDPRERFENIEASALCRDLLGLRREDPVFRSVRRTGHVDGAVFGPDAFLLRFFGERQCDTRLLVVNLGRDLLLGPAPEPLLAPPPGFDWALLWSSEAPVYGGVGAPPWPTEGEWHLAGETAVVLYPKECEP
ncbi:MAG: malto-oligosyltrehalose trehalohydrolase [Syntrophobacteraceae bacterium]|nr:malto-oligosyltrehalose trehalohydrolase [Syntrophobacteraceae bacterium]